MKKIILILPFVIFWSGAAFAEQLVIKLESGNEIVINYKGAVQNVTLNGKGDAIKSISLPDSAAAADTHTGVEGQKITSGHKEPSSPSVTSKNKDKDNEKSWWLRLKWREPTEY